ncbi:MAG: crossover junction endodeoxyribonuclease RuvC [Candidatus Sungbacteria bacterium]|uniref:Crossover junction endodeoxyribonuclease RuvC n=1 Tax=Candidatus Sungiibacteriota bacterium TaxID=2750080 RepID=A0A931YDN1_9BACT|nr:crossover junction endodeoxyribonuclease RuvC [Candidatus Sungbacteria bacterium]
MPNSTIILGADPGTSRAGYGLIKKEDDTLSLLAYGCVEIRTARNHLANLLILYDSFMDIIKKHRPDVLAIEKLFFFKNAKTITKVSEARGVIILAALKSGLEIKEFTPLQIKQAVSAYGRANKQAVQKMVRLILSLDKDPQPDDAADALAAAICCANSTQTGLWGTAS